MKLTNRTRQKAEEVKKEFIELRKEGHIELYDLDLSSVESIKAFASNINNNYKHIDNLINNAGVFMRDTQFTKEGYEMTFGVNYIGNYLLTEMLMSKLLEAKSKVIMVSSVGCYWGSLKQDKNSFYRRINSFKTYFDSKLANLIYAINLNEKHPNLIVLAADPGIVYSHIFKWKTRVGRFLYKIQRLIMKSPVKGSKVICDLTEIEEKIETDNILFNANNQRKLPKKIRSKDNRNKYIDFNKDKLTYLLIKKI